MVAQTNLTRQEGHASFVEISLGVPLCQGEAGEIIFADLLTESGA